MRQKKLRILFRTSGGRAPKKQLGFGHVYRCINLADFLKKNELFFLIEDYGGVKKVLKGRGFDKISNIINGINTTNDIRKTINAINKHKIDVLIIDKFDIKIRFLNEIRKHTKVIVISDLWKYNYPADLVVNGFVGFENKITKNKFNAKCFLGPRFQILNKSFSQIPVLKNKKYKLLATFGGFDERNIVEFLLEQLIMNKQKIKIKIILGPATKKTKKIRKLEKEYGQNLDIVNQTTNMFREISNAEFGLCSGGITTYEFAALKVNFGIICQVKHQLLTAREWQHRGVAVDFGLVNKNTSKEIQVFLKNIMERKFLYEFNKSHIVDGLGAQRIANEILRLF